MELRSYQIEAVNSIVNSYVKGEKRSIIDMPAGTGKTMVILSAIEMIIENDPSAQFSIIVNTRSLKIQLEQRVRQKLRNSINYIEIDTFQSWNKNKTNFDNSVFFLFGLHFNNFIKIYGYLENLKDTRSYLCYLPESQAQLTKAAQLAPVAFRYTVDQGMREGILVPIVVHRDFMPDECNGFNIIVDKVLSSVSSDGNRRVIFVCKNISDANLVYEDLSKKVDADSIALVTSQTKDIHALEDKLIREERVKYCIGVNLILDGIEIPFVTDVVLLRKLSMSGLLQAIARVSRFSWKKTIGHFWDFYRNDLDNVVGNYYSNETVTNYKNTSWIDAYKEIRNLLIELYLNKKSESSSALFGLCSKSDEFRTLNSWFDNNKNIKLLDPLRVYASISDSKISTELKVSRINNYCELLSGFLGGFHEYTHYENIDFSGSANLNYELLVFDRKNQQFDYIWRLFHDAAYFPEEGIKQEGLLASKDWGVNDLRNLSTFLYLVQPNYFLPIDKQTISFLKQHGKIKKEPNLVGEYNKLLNNGETTAYKSIFLLSRAIVNYSDLTEFEKNDYDNFIGDLSLSFLSENKCRILAITPRKKCNYKFLRSLSEDRCYKFYQYFDVNGDEIEYISEFDHGLFDLSELKLSISSIVGKNGAGKSTIIELLMAGFNNLACKTNDYSKINGLHELVWIEDINLDFWFETDAIYRVSLEGRRVEILRYKQDSDNRYVFDVIIDTNEFDYGSFFYTLNVNYSLHALNSLYQGKWIERLFHKNDGYQTPIVLEPYRVEGNINVNVQEGLAKQRLLSNILMLDTSGGIDEYSLRVLKDGVNASYLSISLNTEKYGINSQCDLISGLHESEVEKLISIVFDVFSVNVLDSRNIDFSGDTAFDFACRYIVNKMYNISGKYLDYKQYFNKEHNRFIYAKRFVSRLYNDHSHITYKLRQAINYIKYGIYKEKSWENISLEEASHAIYNIVNDNRDEKLEYLLPPSFFNIEIYLENKVEFSGLSSGEKQKIYVISSILYHLKNVDSVSASGNEKLIKFNYVNIFMDEVELCFHPELQRTFIYDLRAAINKLTLNYIYGVNICFVTHSPFLLSDIPSSNIMFLDNKNINSSSLMCDISSINQNTFAANIHDLLVDGFFMDSSIGKFAEEAIREIVKFHGKVAKSVDKDSLMEEYLLLSKRFNYVYEIISDKYIQGVVYNHLSEIKEKLGMLEDKSNIELEIDNLERKLRSLKEIYNASN
ncbi:DEAD/DEAH box helicase family protein [Vibrio vulnificus]|nr:DEAD/DEAH box helicase family protein [Vibrio vulnificus]